MSLDVSPEAFGIKRLRSVCSFRQTVSVQLRNVLVWLQLVLVLELAKCLNIFIQRLNGSSESSPQVVIGLPQPSVLVWQYRLLVWIYGAWLLAWPERCLEHLFTMGLEQMSQQDWLKLRNLLKALDSFVKDVHNPLDDVLWVS